MKSYSIFFPLIILLAATLVQCHYDHWYQHFNKDSSTSTTAKVLAADAKAEGSQGNVKNSDSFPDDEYPDDFEERMGRRATLAVGVVIAIAVACIIVCCGICYCFIRLCNVMCNHDQPGHVIVMNPVMPAQQPVPQVLVQQVPYQPGTYPSQQNLNYAGQMNAQMQQIPPEAHAQKSQEANKFQTNQEIYQQSNYSPHDSNLQPLIAPPPPYQKF